MVSSKNRDRLLKGEIADKLFEKVIALPKRMRQYPDILLNMIRPSQ
jgi:hypothetical protein